MFVTLDDSFPGFESVLKTHELQGLEGLDHLNPIYAGGYPTALLFAPRDKFGNISNFYCNDIDVYGENPEHTQKIINTRDVIRAHREKNFSLLSLESILIVQSNDFRQTSPIDKIP